MTKQGKNNHTAILFVLFMMLFPDLYGQIEFTYQSDYYYVKGKDATSLPGNWMNPGYPCCCYQSIGSKPRANPRL